MHRTVINLKGTGESETDEIERALDGQSRSMYFFSLGVRSTHPTSLLLLVLLPLLLAGCFAVLVQKNKRIASFPSVHVVECSVSLFLREWPSDEAGPSIE